jgi:putative PIN family toxin of toxin-antitoxin system
VRAVLDANVIISALLAPNGSPAKVLQAWLDGDFELVLSPLLLAELERALAYPKLRKRVTAAEAEELVELLRQDADLREDPAEPPPVRSADNGDDYVIALAAAAQAVIVSGDRHLLDLGDDLPVYSPAAFLEVLERGDR